MLRAQKKISKRVIKEDTLVTTYFKAQTWYDENRKRVSVVGGILLVVALGLWFYSNNLRANNDRATTDFARVFTFYDNGQYLIAINGIPERNIVGLQSIVDNYGSTTAGNIAKFYLANCYYNTQDYDKALKYFDDFSGGTSLLANSAIAGVAACYEAKGDYKKAAENYEKAALKNADDPNAADNLLNAGRDYVKAGEKDRAVELLKRLKRDYPTSLAARDVDRYIAEAGV
ncbi:MAG TPA: tetratricopeptide repeat protein [Bacteroidota bacterium]|nr:tetratricopeptide repeat protein [Bacteroidota bacterium]